MSNEKATARPWKLETERYGGWKFDGGFNGRILGSDGSVIYAGPSSFNALTGKDERQCKANAELIVTAVNEREALLLRIEGLEKTLKTLLGEHADIRRGQHNASAIYQIDVKGWDIEVARAALSGKGEGEWMAEIITTHMSTRLWQEVLCGASKPIDGPLVSTGSPEYVTCEDYIIVDRHRKCYAWFRDGEQQGNWLRYHDESEPERVAEKYDAAIREKL